MSEIAKRTQRMVRIGTVARRVAARLATIRKERAASAVKAASRARVDRARREGQRGRGDH